MKALRQQFRIWRSTLSREGRVGLGLLALSAAVYVFVLSPGQTGLANLAQEVDSLSAQAQRSAARPESRANTPSEQLAAYYRIFPATTSAPDWLDKIFAAAEAQHLQLIDGKYRETHARAGPLVLYHIDLPVAGRYGQVHRFLGTVLTAIPTIALDSVTFERHKIGDSVVQAHIRLTLYLGRPG